MVFMKRIYLASMLALLASMPSAPVAAQAFGNAIAIDGGQVFVGLRQIAVRAGLCIWAGPVWKLDPDTATRANR